MVQNVRVSKSWNAEERLALLNRMLAEIGSLLEKESVPPTNLDCSRSEFIATSARKRLETRECMDMVVAMPAAFLEANRDKFKEFIAQ